MTSWPVENSFSKLVGCGHIYRIEVIGTDADGNTYTYRETVETKHHDEPRYVYATGETMIAQATMQNHADAELVMLDWLVGREPPFSAEDYKPY